MKSDELLAWIDIETTGLDVWKDSLLEVALLVTDQNDEPLYEKNWVLHHKFLGAKAYHPVVMEMHAKSNLWSECEHSNLGHRDFVREFKVCTEKILRDNPQYTKFVMAGSGVARFDYTYFQVRMPELLEHFNYYTLDVGVVRRALELAGAFSERDDENPAENLEHRALMDVTDHWNEWLYYRGILSAMFLNGPIEDLSKK